MKAALYALTGAILLAWVLWVSAGVAGAQAFQVGMVIQYKAIEGKLDMIVERQNLYMSAIVNR